VVVAVCAYAGPSVVTAQQARLARSSHRVDIRVNCNPHGTELIGTFSGQPWGSGKCTGTLIIPRVTLTFHTKMGNATMKYTGIVNGAVVTGHYKWVSGTGKLRGLSGGGALRGDLTGHYHYTGTAVY
jgi:hypothetical protein